MKTIEKFDVNTADDANVIENTLAIAFARAVRRGDISQAKAFLLISEAADIAELILENDGTNFKISMDGEIKAMKVGANHG